MKTKFNRDETVTVWNIYNQSWNRIHAKAAFRDDRLMATLDATERARISAMAYGWKFGDAKKMAHRILSLADDGGTIAPEDMQEITDEPTLHTHCDVDRALEALGLQYVAKII